MHNSEFLAVIIGMFLIGAALLLPQKPRIDSGSWYYKLNQDPKNRRKDD